MALRLCKRFDLLKNVQSIRFAHHDAAHEKGQVLWKYATLLVAFPAVGVAIWNTERQEHLNPYKRPEFQTYDHLRLRTKPFPWGDGNHSLFHNPHMNALPDGYEAEEEHHGHDGHH